MRQDRTPESRADQQPTFAPWNAAAYPSALPPLPGESSVLARARDLIRRGPRPLAGEVGAPHPSQLAASRPALPPSGQADAHPSKTTMVVPVKTREDMDATTGIQTQRKPSARPNAKTYLRPDGTEVPDRRAGQRSPRRDAQPRMPLPVAASSVPPITPVRGRATEIILELPSSYTVAPSPSSTPGVKATAVPAEMPTAANLFEADEEDECPICHGAGFLRINVPIGDPNFGKAFPCACRQRTLARRRRDDLWKLSRLEAFAEMTFENFNATWPGVREAFAIAREYASEQEPPWLLLSGACGCGKTHLAAAIANARFAQGEVVLFSVVPQLLDHLRATFAPASETTYDALFEKVREAGLLILDDLGAEHTTPWAQEKLFQIINHRYIHQMPTVVTTNQHLSTLDDRIRSRMSDIRVVRHVNVQADDYRPRNAPTRRSAWNEPRY